jgi:hypothetical protein
MADFEASVDPLATFDCIKSPPMVVKEEKGTTFITPAIW